MVREQLVARGVRNRELLEAFRVVPREEFVAPKLREFAYNDHPLSIEEGQTISQPYIVAMMAEAAQLEDGDRVLEIGTGSGYAAAVLARLADRVYSIERHDTLARSAEARLQDLGYRNVEIKCGDGTKGWQEKGPFDAILVAAGGPEVPESLRDQLKMGGRLIIPVGDAKLQRLLSVTRKTGDQYEERNLGAVKFVPLVGEEGWPE